MFNYIGQIFIAVKRQILSKRPAHLVPLVICTRSFVRVVFLGATILMCVVAVVVVRGV